MPNSAPRSPQFRSVKRRSATPAWLAAALPGLLAALALFLVQIARPAPIARLGDMVFDAYQRAAPRPFHEAPVRVVDIDDATIAKFGQWPWPRTDVARLTQALADAGAAAIAFDIVFSEPDRTSPVRMAEILRKNPRARGDYADIAALTDHDAILGETFSRTPAVAGLFLTRETNAARPAPKAGFAILGGSPLARIPAYNGAIPPLPVIGDHAAGGGFVTIAGAGDGIIRRAPLLSRIGDQIVPSLSLEALRVAQGAGGIMIKSSTASGELGAGPPGVVALKVGQFQAPTTPSGELWMHYREPRPDRITSAGLILGNQLSPAEMRRLFEGQIVFIGTGASGLRDLVATPLRDRELGVMVHAEAVEQMILGEFLVRPDWADGLERVVLLVLGVGMAFLLRPLGAALGGVAAATGLAGVGVGSWLAFQKFGLLVDPTYPALCVGAVYIACTATAFYREERARAYIRSAFDRYLSPDLVERIARDPSQLELGGEERDMTVLFCDIRSFSRLSERMAPQGIIQFLIEFLTPMTDILLSRKATIDKYIGDAILAFWNAPLDDPDHPRNAALAALAMQERLEALNQPDRPNADFWPGRVQIGVGINTGPCCVGNMGSAQRLSYSLIGDTVNLASRIEGLTKYYGCAIAIGEETAQRVADFALVELDRVRVVGRDTPETVFALLGPPEKRSDAGFQKLLGAQTAMLDAYRAQDWASAEAQLPIVADGGLAPLAALYAERISTFRASPPAPDWDGVYEATSK
jgi:adenylate cyclase